jgi:hypothetical protein
MKAQLLLRERRVLGRTRFAELVIWELPVPSRESAHRFKYLLALVIDGRCVLRFDNEAGEGDHKHVGEAQIPYVFTSLTRLVADFWTDVEHWPS